MAEWHLKFFVEPGEAELRFRHLFRTFQADDHVESVEISVDSTQPGAHGIRVVFKPGYDKPANQRLHHCDKVYGTLPSERKSRYERLLADDFFDD